MMIVLMILALATAPQPRPAVAGPFSPAQIRTMCRGETDEPAEFRTDSAFRLLANIQRSKCRMYLLGVADGILRSTHRNTPALCLASGFDREALADRLMEAVLGEAGNGASSIPSIVERVLRSQSRCP